MFIYFTTWDLVKMLFEKGVLCPLGFHKKYAGDGICAPQWMCARCDWVGHRLTLEEMRRLHR
jgi:hypothetical protein